MYETTESMGIKHGIGVRVDHERMIRERRGNADSEGGRAADGRHGGGPGGSNGCGGK